MTTKDIQIKKPAKAAKMPKRRKAVTAKKNVTPIIVLPTMLPSILTLGDVLEYNKKMKMVLIKIIAAKGDDGSEDKYIFTPYRQSTLSISLEHTDKIPSVMAKEYGEGIIPMRWLAPTEKQAQMLREGLGYLGDDNTAESREFLLADKTNKGLPKTMNLVTGEVNICFPNGEVNIRPITSFRRDALDKTCTFLHHKKVPASHMPIFRDLPTTPYILK